MTDLYRTSGAEDRSVLVVTFFGRVFGLNPSDGSVRWEARVPGGIGGADLLIDGGRVFIATQEALTVLEYPSGRVVVQTPMPGTYKRRPSMVLERGWVFVGSGGEVCCFDRDGRHLWTQAFKGKGVDGVSLGFPGNTRHVDAKGS